MTCRSLRPVSRSPFGKVVFALVAVGLTAACTSGGSAIPALPQDRYPITVRQTRSLIEIPVPPHKFALSYEEIDALTVLAAEYRDAGHGPIIIALPVGGGNDEAAVINGAEVRDVLYAQGLPYRMIQGTAYAAQGRVDAPLVIMVDRYVAEAPACHEAWDNFADTWRGRNTRNFGCATQANLAAVVTDPGDLLGLRPQDPADAQRRVDVIDGYRSGEPTVTTRSADESVAISDAVQ